MRNAQTLLPAMLISCADIQRNDALSSAAFVHDASTSRERGPFMVSAFQSYERLMKSTLPSLRWLAR